MKVFSALANGYTPMDKTGTMKEGYRYRGLPCRNAGQGATHSICGVDRLGGEGVLEWCYGEEDAARMYKQMRKHWRFHSLSIGDGEGRPLQRKKKHA